MSEEFTFAKPWWGCRECGAAFNTPRPESVEDRYCAEHRIQPPAPVRQIRYTKWGEGKDEHPNYFRDIDDIADIIGAMLETYGILVTQTKEKFGQCRVYVAGGMENPLDQNSYRHVYHTVCRLLPHYRSAILSGADFPKLLKDIDE